jgi:hypothetical protein
MQEGGQGEIFDRRVRWQAWVNYHYYLVRDLTLETLESLVKLLSYLRVNKRSIIVKVMRTASVAVS